MYAYLVIPQSQNKSTELIEMKFNINVVIPLISHRSNKGRSESHLQLLTIGGRDLHGI